MIATRIHTIAARVCMIAIRLFTISASLLVLKMDSVFCRAIKVMDAASNPAALPKCPVEILQLKT